MYDHWRGLCMFGSGRKKKLNNYITFPETLDMSKYLPGAGMIFAELNLISNFV